MAHYDEIVRKQYPARTPLPPGYEVQLVGDHCYWVREAGDIESSIHWNHWACWRDAWEHYRANPHQERPTDASR